MNKRVRVQVAGDDVTSGRIALLVGQLIPMVLKSRYYDFRIRKPAVGCGVI